MSEKLFSSVLGGEARFVSSEGEAAIVGYKFTREWIKLRADLSPGLFITKEADVEVTNPTADGVTYTGTFVGTQTIANANIEDNDRQVRIRQTLTLVTTIGDSDDLPS